jgi:UDP:flavonoid glycosyltransferase YjiC (YdhE family)
MFPQTSEQKGVAERVFELGAGVKLVKADATAILESVTKVIEDSTYKKNAEKIADGFKKCSGAKGAADKIIQVCNEV